MKIASITVDSFDIPLTVPYRLAYGLISETRQYLITLYLDNGMEGYGVGTADEHITGETDDSLANILQPMNLSWLIGKDINDISEISLYILKKYPKNSGARCALDIALHDTYGKYLNKPLIDIFGRCVDSLPTSVTVGICSSEETCVQIESYLQRGFNEIKVKTGTKLLEDIDRIQNIHSHFGFRIGIKIDPNMGYNLLELKQFLEGTKGIPIQFIEQPLPPEIMQSCSTLEDSYKQKLMVDESLVSYADAEKILSLPDHFGLMNIKLQKCGGIFPAEKIATLASKQNKSLMWGCFDESVISIASALHIAYSNPATKYLDLDGSFDLKWDFAEGGFTMENGHLILNRQPGLGVSIKNKAALKNQDGCGVQSEE